MKIALLKDLRAHLATKTPCAVITDLAGPGQALVASVYGTPDEAGDPSAYVADFARAAAMAAETGAHAIEVDEGGPAFSVNGRKIREGEWITVDGSTGRVFAGRTRLVPSISSSPLGPDGPHAPLPAYPVAHHARASASTFLVSHGSMPQQKLSKTARRGGRGPRPPRPALSASGGGVGGAAGTSNPPRMMALPRFPMSMTIVLPSLLRTFQPINAL